MEKKCAIITGPGFQDEEVIYPYYRLMEEGYNVEIATKDGACGLWEIWSSCQSYHSDN